MLGLWLLYELSKVKLNDLRVSNADQHLICYSLEMIRIETKSPLYQASVLQMQATGPLIPFKIL